MSIWSSHNKFSNNAINKNFIAERHGHVVATELSRAQLCLVLVRTWILLVIWGGCLHGDPPYKFSAAWWQYKSVLKRLFLLPLDGGSCKKMFFLTTAIVWNVLLSDDIAVFDDIQWQLINVLLADDSVNVSMSPSNDGPAIQYILLCIYIYTKRLNGPCLLAANLFYGTINSGWKVTK